MRGRLTVPAPQDPEAQLPRSASSSRSARHSPQRPPRTTRSMRRTPVRLQFQDARDSRSAPTRRRISLQRPRRSAQSSPRWSVWQCPVVADKALASASGPSSTPNGMDGKDDLRVTIAPVLIRSQRPVMVGMPIAEQRNQIARIQRDSNLLGCHRLNFTVASFSNPLVRLFHRHLSCARDTRDQHVPLLH